MQIVHHHLHLHDDQRPLVPLWVDRATLAKRRWRGTAEDGKEFGFDLDYPLADGDAVVATDSAVYVVRQTDEAVITIPLGLAPAQAARLGWLLGNLHFPIQVMEREVRVPDDPAVRQMLEREHLPFTPASAVFCPLGGGHSHAH